MKAGLKIKNFIDIEDTIASITRIIIVTVLGVNLFCVLVLLIQFIFITPHARNEGLWLSTLSIYILFALVYGLALFLLRRPGYHVFASLLSLVALNMQVSLLNWQLHFSNNIYLLYFIMPVLSYFMFLSTNYHWRNVMVISPVILYFYWLSYNFRNHIEVLDTLIIANNYVLSLIIFFILIVICEILKRAFDMFKLVSSLDGLTGIPNRRFFNETIQREWNRCQRNEKPLSVILIDIDFFKTYNDTYGHQAGDRCIIAVAEILQSFTKRGGDMLARYGGEEFIALLPETAHKNARMLAEKMCKRIEATRIPHSQSKVTSYVTISLGVATTVPAAGLLCDTIIFAADKALYAAKEEGRNRVKAAVNENYNRV